VAGGSMKLNSVGIDPAAPYRVTVNNYLALGGDGFTELKQGVKPQFGVYDDEALFAYFQKNTPIAPPPADRITQSN
jgi:5'-nucleotidase